MSADDSAPLQLNTLQQELGFIERQRSFYTSHIKIAWEYKKVLF